MARKSIPTPDVTEHGAQTIGGTHGHPKVNVLRLAIGGYTFYRGATTGNLYEPCDRCSEHSGHIRGFEHVADGVCFACTGRGYLKARAGSDIDALRETVRKRLVAAARRERKAAEDAEKAQAGIAAWSAANPAVAEGLAAVRDRIAALPADTYGHATIGLIDDTLCDFAYRAKREVLTERQTAYAAALLQRQAERDAQAAAEEAQLATTQHLGEIGQPLTVTGTIKVAMTIEVPNFSGYGTSAKRLIIVDVDGSDVKAISDAQWAWDAEKGNTVILTGTVKKHGEYQGAKQTQLGRVRPVK